MELRYSAVVNSRYRHIKKNSAKNRAINGFKVWLAASVLLLAACANNPGALLSLDTIPPLYLADNRLVTAEQVAQRVASPNLLALDDDMRAFVEQHVGSQRHDMGRLMALHSAVKGVGVLNLRYDAFADGSARETFHRGTANCLSYASLFVALAREAGLKAEYQWQLVRPQWTRMGERVAVGLHVNALVKLRNGQQFHADIDPLQSRNITGSRKLSEDQALAMYHNNLAMDALANGTVEDAWLQSVRALQLAPRMAYLWVNLGAVYRRAGQHRDAEQAYLHALSENPYYPSAMSNLVVLYDIEGRDTERAYWYNRVERYRESNPYFHAWRGDKASEQGEFAEALLHYEQALALRPKDSHLLYAAGLLNFRLKQYQQADALISKAIKNAKILGDVGAYKLQLNAVREAALAAQ